MFIKSILRSFGQVMLQKNALTGFIILGALFYHSYTIALAALSASLAATLTALLFRLNKQATQDGLYAFNAVLIGAGLLAFLSFDSIQTWVLILAGAVLSVFLQNFFMSKKLPTYTLPFILITWLLLSIASLLFPNLFFTSTPTLYSAINPFVFTLQSFSQVFFISHTIVGILFLLAILLNSPIAGIYAFIAALLSGIAALEIPFIEVDSVQIGVYGYNAVLSSIAFAGNQKSDILWVLISIVFSLLFMLLFLFLPFPALTFPFVWASISTLLIQKYYQRKALEYM